jgi:Glyoxalase/Bleomycin resistance protein/Dioxygenase superfamily
VTPRCLLRRFARALPEARRALIVPEIKGVTRDRHQGGKYGIHHVTAIAGDPVKNLDFYARDLGLRFVKKTVNFDEPSTYHFYYGDETGSPGTILTFFPGQTPR